MPNSSRTVLITGASSGIGKDAAAHLAQRGYRVFAGMRRPGSVTLPKDVDVIQLDITDDASIAEAVDTILTRSGRLDALINNAGRSLIGPIEEATIDQAAALFDTNVLGILRLCRAVLPIMRAQHSGRIVNITSVAGIMPVPYMGLYSATKSAIEALSEALDYEVRSFGIHVAVVQPSYVRTNIDRAAERGADILQAYSAERTRVARYFSAKIAGASDPSNVVRAIERAIKVDRFRRLPGSREARLVNAMRRWLPAALVDRAVRHSLGLDRRHGV